MRGIWGIDPGWGITAVRLVTGVILLVAGVAKFMVGTEEVTNSFINMRIPIPSITGQFIMLLEVVGGAMLILGLAGRWMGLIFTIQFFVATFYVKWRNVGFAGSRFDLLMLAASILLFLAGPGRAAIDGLWQKKEAKTPAE